MRNICLSLLLATSAHAYADDSETVVVTGSRIPHQSVGPIFSSGPIDEGDHACAEPNCGHGPEDPSGGGYTSHASKQQRNKQARQKVQAKKQVVAQAIKNTKSQSEKSLWTTLTEWLADATITFGTTRETETPSGKILRDTTCAHVDLSKEKGPNPCVEKNIDVEKVYKSNGQLTNQLQLSFVVYESCYYEKKCGPDYITFIAANQQELNYLLNDALGENHF
ncbi:hypothetical protein [Oligoflexus tunisiensis]|uniref:hypothetical protein n=1 Tax=Oligoflexus tunisiensis TaxID=708132 RepID=UPI00114CA7BF|nr:hypothetical protein [Oligoflexus tunisiensis]